MKTFAFLLILSVLSFALPGLVAPRSADPGNLPPGVHITTSERSEDPDASIRVIPFDVWVLVNGEQVFRGEVSYINEHWYGAAHHARIFCGGPHGFMAIDLPPGSDVQISTKPPSGQDMVPLGHFGLRLSSDNQPLYSGEVWEIHIQRAAHDTYLEAMVVDSNPHIYKLDLGAHVEARSYIP